MLTEAEVRAIAVEGARVVASETLEEQRAIAAESEEN